MHSSLKGVTDRFPYIKDRAAQLFENDEAFRDLCDEYEMCSLTASRLESDAEASEAMRKEYAALRLRLEGELLRYLGEVPNGGIPGAAKPFPSPGRGGV
jgi:hypothetical protein